MFCYLGPASFTQTITTFSTTSLLIFLVFFCFIIPTRMFHKRRDFSNLQRMRSSEEVPVCHLVVDASAFIKNAPLHDIGAAIYTISEVVAEIRDKKTRERMQFLPYELQLRTPTSESLAVGELKDSVLVYVFIDLVKEISKKTGDYPALSVTDLKLLALSHDLHVQYAGQETVNYEVKNVLDIVDDQGPDSTTEKTPFGFVVPRKTTELDEQWNSDEEGDDEGWIDETNLAGVLGEEYGVADKIDGPIVVAVISSDFALQNVLMHMKMHLVSIEGLVIKQLKSFVLRCHSCYKLTSQMEKEFCPKCGNKSLDRVAVTVDSDGRVRVHINWKKLLSKRTKAAQLRTIKGGKHDNCDRFFEDQRIPHNRASKVAENSMDDSPFLKHDVTSRSAILGIRPNRRLKTDRRR